MRERTGCETLDKAIVLAPKVGVDPKMVTCPFLNVCTGETCMVMEKGDMKTVQEFTPGPPDPASERVIYLDWKARHQGEVQYTATEIFTARLQKTVNKNKLV